MKNCSDYRWYYCLTDSERAMIDYAVKIIVDNHKDDECAYVVSSIRTAVYCAISTHVDNEAFAEEMLQEEQEKQKRVLREIEQCKQDEAECEKNKKYGEKKMKQFILEFCKHCKYNSATGCQSTLACTNGKRFAEAIKG